MLIVGLMSGTSADGVDAALVEIREQGTRLRLALRAFYRLPYAPALQRRILTAATAGSVDEVCRLNMALGEWFARAALGLLRRARVRPARVAMIGSHGQTIHHLPLPQHEPGLGRRRSTLQIGSPSVIAERTGITTVADFRARDVAAGGEGAPLTPYAHALCFRDARRSRLVVNLGGICNVTYLPAGRPHAIQAFDTGPANMLLDALAAKLSHGRVQMDRHGRWAARGTVDPRLLARWLRHPYLRRRPPKSTGREEFGARFLSAVPAGRRPEDLLATCSLFTAMTVGGARRWLRGPVDEVVVGGGGIHNHTLMRHLADVFAPAPVRTFEALGYDSRAFEAMTFALLAYQSAHGRPTNVPAVTGARRAAVLGTLTPGDRRRTGRGR
jgi:anhydro-N-acetylmuramic acid kinase